MSPGRVDVLRVKLSEPSVAQHEYLEFTKQILEIIQRIRGIEYETSTDSIDESGREVVVDIGSASGYLDVLPALQSGLVKLQRYREAEALFRALDRCIEHKHLGGLGFAQKTQLSENEARQVLFQVEAWLESLSAAEKSRKLPLALSEKPKGRKPMTLAQKILAHHAIAHTDPSGLQIGDFLRVSVDWIIASEISWIGMKKTLDQTPGGYKAFRNDRFWLAGDHVVDPRNYETDLSKRLIKASEDAATNLKLTDYQGANYTIIHTEFVRARAEPGMLAIGSDSHTCSSGAIGCLAIGLGAAEVAMALATGETWFKVPEVVNVRFVGAPTPGIGGKDTILYILGELKRNTVAAERIVEFTGPALKHLSIDARFAISNMCTEFGAITGVFIPDEVTKSYISTRKAKNRKSSSLYFAPDEGAPYVATYDIDLSKVRSLFAIYPNPDDVVPVSSKQGMKLDGCFIGACTTALEDLILAAMVLEIGLKKGLHPNVSGKRHVVPGSLPVRNKIEELGLLENFVRAGFEIGAPGCSFCVGMGSDQAQVGEVWLSSQNRNFKNRMGKGSFGNLSSAATVAASSFSMQVTDPQAFLDELDVERFDRYRGHSPIPERTSIRYVEPALKVVSRNNETTPKTSKDAGQTLQLERPVIKSKVVRLGEYIDTDALAPAEYLVTALSDKEIGSHCLEHTNPDFRSKVDPDFSDPNAGSTSKSREAHRIVVAGKAFGVGSSREEAVRALMGCGVEAVIAPSFAFIFGRNLPNLGLLGVLIPEDSEDPQGFYALAQEGTEVEIKILERVVRVKGPFSGASEESWKEFPFALSDMEVALLAHGGISHAYQKYGDHVYGRLCGDDNEEIGVSSAGHFGAGDTIGSKVEGNSVGEAGNPLDEELQW